MQPTNNNHTVDGPTFKTSALSTGELRFNSQTSHSIDLETDTAQRLSSDVMGSVLELVDLVPRHWLEKKTT